jgi:hypothetical protein
MSEQSAADLMEFLALVGAPLAVAAGAVVLAALLGLIILSALLNIFGPED